MQVLLEQIHRPFNQVACIGSYFKISLAILVFNLKLSTVTFVKFLTVMLVVSNPVLRANIQYSQQSPVLYSLTYTFILHFIMYVPVCLLGRKMCTLLCIARGGNNLMKSNPDCRLPHNRKVVSFRNSKAI